MRQLPKGRVMAPIDLGPAILAETNHEVFAAPYHRNNDGNLAMLKLMLAPPSVAHQMLSDRYVDYVVICRTAPNRNIIERALDGLEAKLARGETPEFLSRSTSATQPKFRHGACESEASVATASSYMHLIISVFSANGIVRPCSSSTSNRMLGRGAKDKEHAMSQKLESAIAVIGIDIGKNSFHVVGHDERGAIVLPAEVVMWPGRSTLCQYADVPDRHGGLCRRASSQPQNLRHWATMPG